MPVGFDVYAHFGSPWGLRVSADNTVRMLRMRGAYVRTHDVGNDNIVVGTTEMGTPPEHRVNIFHVNPGDILELMDKCRHLDREFERQLNVCVPFWELPRVPDSWLPVLRGMDLVLAPTWFVADAIQAGDSSVEVEHFPQTVMVPEDIEPNRVRFGLPEDATIFGLSFAAQAVIERKNPWAAIKAFHSAFPDQDDVRLVVRAYDAGGADASPTLRRLRDAAGDDSRIIVASERLSYDEVMALYASYDVFVSLHRSEGLGLGPMEAMMVGTPVVATNWSGVLDFMTESNSCLVDFELVPVAVDPASPYGSECVKTEEYWAEPDIDDAARLMRRLYDEPGWRRELGARARRDMRDRHRRIVAACFMDDLTVLAARIDDPSYGHRGRSLSLSRMQHDRVRRRRIVSLKRAIVRVLRWFRLKPPAPAGETRS